MWFVSNVHHSANIFHASHTISCSRLTFTRRDPSMSNQDGEAIDEIRFPQSCIQNLYLRPIVSPHRSSRVVPRQMCSLRMCYCASCVTINIRAILIRVDQYYFYLEYLCRNRICFRDKLTRIEMSQILRKKWNFSVIYSWLAKRSVCVNSK